MGDVIRRNWNAQHPDEEKHPLVPNPFITKDGERVYFTDTEYGEFSRRAGQIADQLVSLNYHGDGRNPNEDDMEVVTDALRLGRARARAEYEGKEDVVPVDEAAAAIFKQQNYQRIENITAGWKTDKARARGEADIARLQSFGFSFDDAAMLLRESWRAKGRKFSGSAFSTRMRNLRQRYGGR